MEKGVKMSEASRAKMRAAWARRRALRLPHPRLGIQHTEESKARISAATKERTAKGADHYAWKGGITADQRRSRKSPGYKTWRRQVRENAGDACEGCQLSPPRRMHAHHIMQFATHPELRLDPTNGVWLCDCCHAEWHAK